MARGNRIILTQDRGIPVEGIITGTPKPGTLVQIDYSVALQGGRHTWKLYDADVDGGRPKSPMIIVVEDMLQGKTTADAYVTGTRCVGFIPWPGCELNLLLADVAGTGDDHALGEVLIPKDTTGKWIATTGSPEIEPAVLAETITDPVADTLAWCFWTGY